MAGLRPSSLSASYVIVDGRLTRASEVRRPPGDTHLERVDRGLLVGEPGWHRRRLGVRVQREEREHHHE
jgi:hypothetical protein